MARKQSNRARQLLQVLVDEDKDWLKEIVQATVQEVLEAEMEEFLGAAPYERTASRRGYRAGYYSRKLMTRVGTIELRVPQDREASFQRSFSSATSAARKRWYWRSWRCTFRGCRRGG